MISFVIPAYNEEALVGRTIAAIHAAAADVPGLGAYEIVVADDGSTDHTAEIAAACRARVVPIARRQISAARNAGARAAAGDPLFFIDADTLLTPAVLRESLGALDAGAVGGCALVRFDGWVPLYARILLAVLVWSFRLARLGGGCCVFCTRAGYDAIGGWDETLFASEEITFITALKRRFGRRRFVVVPSLVITSGRKVRTYSGLEMLRMLARLMLRPRQAARSRDALDLWYAPRRPDPLHQPAARE
jgi:glycosyltransferase involved in cell wall biosynthesis